jgi:hypothetical protein
MCGMMVQVLMTDPMMAADGLTYQRAAIKAWIDKGYKGACTCLDRDLSSDWLFWLTWDVLCMGVAEGRGLVSPRTSMSMSSILLPNHSIRTLVRRRMAEARG